MFDRGGGPQQAPGDGRRCPERAEECWTGIVDHCRFITAVFFPVTSDQPITHCIVCDDAYRLRLRLHLEVNYLSFFNLEKYLIFVYFEVKCWTFLFLFYISYFEVKYPHARE